MHRRLFYFYSFLISLEQLAFISLEQLSSPSKMPKYIIFFLLTIIFTFVVVWRSTLHHCLFGTKGYLSNIDPDELEIRQSSHFTMLSPKTHNQDHSRNLRALKK